jgi:hypothetical protein
MIEVCPKLKPGEAKEGTKVLYSGGVYYICGWTNGKVMLSQNRGGAPTLAVSLENLRTMPK